MYKAANRPWPVLSEDPFIDYMVMEAVALKAAEEDRKAERERKIAEWKKDTSALETLR